MAEPGEPLAGYTTLRLGGPARRLVHACSRERLVEAVRDADRNDEPVLLLAGGSNLVVSDDGFPGTVVRIETRGVEVQDAGPAGVRVTVEAGEPWDGFVSRAVEVGWVGVEALSGIPGSVGATPIQNVGAYGQEVSSTITEVVAYDRLLGETVTLAGEECGFSYRHSRFKADPARHVVLRVRFALEDAGGMSAPVKYPETARALGVEAGDRVPLAKARETVLALRSAKGMVLAEGDHDTWSAGSFFTNPVLGAAEYAAFLEQAHARLGADVTPPAYPDGTDRTKLSAAWLIDKAGFTKGYGTGPARLSGKHTLALTNRGGATAQDLLALAREIRDGVRAAFGVTLVNEPVTVGVAL